MGKNEAKYFVSDKEINMRNAGWFKNKIKTTTMKIKPLKLMQTIASNHVYWKIGQPTRESSLRFGSWFRKSYFWGIAQCKIS